MQGEKILYPCYFNAGLTRSEGRRIHRSKAVKDPTPGDIEKALKKGGVRFRTEAKSHPAFWWKQEGRIVVTWEEGKEKLLKMVAGYLEARR